MINHEDIHIATPFDLFMAKLVGQRILVEEMGLVLEAYQYKGKIFIYKFHPPIGRAPYQPAP